MDLRFIVYFILFSCVKAFDNNVNSTLVATVPHNVFNGVYSECFLHLSYSCLQRKTLLYLKELNNLSEVSVIGDYVKFVRVNKSITEELEVDVKAGDSEELAFKIDEAVDDFFDSHVLKFYALGRNITVPRNEAFVGRKRKGGGGGGGHGGGHGGGEDGGKKKMMMMAMMCMKMKLMMMVPAMMGMMGMMSFKGMMFSMMSFMISKMMLLMKILEKKGGGGGAIGGGGDGGWPAGGGGGAWMPAGGQDYSGGGGGGYDANGQWQSRSIMEPLKQYKINNNYLKANDHNVPETVISARDDKTTRNIWKTYDSNEWNSLSQMNPDSAVNQLENDHQELDNNNKSPEISFVKPVVRYSNGEKEIIQNPVLVYKKSNVDFGFEDPGISKESNNNALKTNVRLKRNAETHNDISFKTLKSSHNKHQNDIGNNLKYENILHDSYFITDLDKSKVKTNKSRQRRSTSIVDMIQNSYIYWVNKVLGINNNRRTNIQKYKIVNGIKYVYHPYRMQKVKVPKVIQPTVTQSEDIKPMVAVEDFNKGEIVEGGVESRMTKKKFNKMKDTVNDAVDENPWE